MPFCKFKNLFLDFILLLGFPLALPLEGGISSGMVITSQPFLQVLFPDPISFMIQHLNNYPNGMLPSEFANWFASSAFQTCKVHGLLGNKTDPGISRIELIVNVFILLADQMTWLLVKKIWLVTLSTCGLHSLINHLATETFNRLLTFLLYIFWIHTVISIIYCYIYPEIIPLKILLSNPVLFFPSFYLFSLTSL